MSTKPKKTGPASSSITPAYKQAQEAKNSQMAAVLHTLATSAAGPKVLAALGKKPGAPISAEQDAMNWRVRYALDEMTADEGRKKRGRPATGRVPDKDRKAKQRALLTQAGGRQLSIELLPEHAAALDAIKARKGYTSDREAVYDWLARAAKRAKA